MIPIHQDPADLVLTLVRGELQSPLTMLKRGSVTVGTWVLSFHIIGESHLVSIKHQGKTVMSELLACVDVAADSAVHQHHFADLAAHTFAQPGYSITVDVEECDTVPPAGENKDLLELTFPEIGGQKPVTRILWKREGKSAIRWQTLHVYPHQGKLICVHSLSYFDSLDYNLSS